MSISSVRVLPVGNALQLFLEPPANAEFWRVLRKQTDDFTGYDDPNAFVLVDGDDKAPVDYLGLANGATYFYRAFYWSGSAWVASASASGVPQASYSDASVDVRTLLRERLEAGLKVEVQRGTLEHEAGLIPVLMAPPVWGEVRWPLVTVHISNEADGQRAIGEHMFEDVQSLDDGDYTEGEGYLGNNSYTIIGWSLNPDERHELAKAIRRILVANGQVFAAAGVITPAISIQDVEDFERYAAPVYQAMCTFTCQAPVLVSSQAPDVIDVQVSATAS